MKAGIDEIRIFDYGAGNLHSLVKAIAPGAREISVETDLRRAANGDLLVLPGVGAFGTAAAAMGNQQSWLADALAEGLPCLGICLGMQLLFDCSEESAGKGIGLIPGKVTRLRTSRVPHMGWNQIEWTASAGPVECGVRANGTDAKARPGIRLDTAYFANAYICEPEDDSPILAWATHEDTRFASVVRRANTVGVQFHPEKSSRAGGAFINALIEELLECR
ncbi:MAG TPA: imidazole glycerol phosphate synthase subunit HisH [Gemmatimonadaceae bacterium]|nr:imidazole glycerol phosphate synthase subunit HisH [Gemmatimonadaceae bacterium]